MKTILIIMFCLTGIYCYAQSPGKPDSTVELRFQLIEKPASGQLALDVQVINHSAKDIYIPHVNYLTFHLYEQSDSGWNELDLYTHQLYSKSVANPTLRR